MSYFNQKSEKINSDKVILITNSIKKSLFQTFIKSSIFNNHKVLFINEEFNLDFN